MNTISINIANSNLIDGRHFNRGPIAGQNGAPSRSAYAMWMIGQEGKTYNQIKHNEMARKNFHRASAFLRGLTYDFNELIG